MMWCVLLSGFKVAKSEKTWIKKCQNYYCFPTNIFTFNYIEIESSLISLNLHVFLTCHKTLTDILDKQSMAKLILTRILRHGIVEHYSSKAKNGQISWKLIENITNIQHMELILQQYSCKWAVSWKSKQICILWESILVQILKSAKLKVLYCLHSLQSALSGSGSRLGVNSFPWHASGHNTQNLVRKAVDLGHSSL